MFFHFLEKFKIRVLMTFLDFHNLGFMDDSYFPLFGVTRRGHQNLVDMFWRCSTWTPKLSLVLLGIGASLAGSVMCYTALVASAGPVFTVGSER